MYLGRSDSLEDTTHVLPRGMQFEVASVDYATYETAADNYGARIVVQLRERHGTVIFAGPTWSFVTGAARSFARRHCIENTLAPFKFRRRGLWTLWDGTVTDESRLETEDATVLAEQYLHQLFPQAGSRSSTSIRRWRRIKAPAGPLHTADPDGNSVRGRRARDPWHAAACRTFGRHSATCGHPAAPVSLPTDAGDSGHSV